MSLSIIRKEKSSVEPSGISVAGRKTRKEKKDEKKKSPDPKSPKGREKKSQQVPSPSSSAKSRSVIQSPPTKILAAPSSSTAANGDGRHVHFSNVARMKLIPADQFPPRPMHAERAIPNPHRRLWVLYRLFKIGGRYRTKRNSHDQVAVLPNTPWPAAELGPPPPPVQYKQLMIFDPPTEEDSERNA